jgi:hypothetical protein
VNGELIVNPELSKTQKGKPAGAAREACNALFTIHNSLFTNRKSEITDHK